MVNNSLLSQKKSLDNLAQEYCEYRNSSSTKIVFGTTISSALFLASPVLAGAYVGSLLGGFPKYYVEIPSENRVESLEIRNGKYVFNPKMPIIAKYSSTNSLYAKIVGGAIGVVMGGLVQDQLLRHFMNLKNSGYEFINPMTVEFINNSSNLVSRLF